jgi:hypothetical protein
MTRCPTCGRRYDGDALFCPADGTALVAAPDGSSDGPSPSDTAPRAAGSASGELDRLLAQSDPEDDVTIAAAPVPATPQTRGLGAIIAVLVALVVGMGALVLWQQRTVAADAQARADAAEAVAEDARREATAQAEAARLDRARADEAASRQPATARTFDATYTTTVWADSPGDGFLALRSGPSTSSGTRLLKIPHGDVLALGACLPPTTSPGGRYGSWCRARYARTDGWVFDAFVSR